MSLREHAVLSGFKIELQALASEHPALLGDANRS
jgi:hypothetical protein